MVLMLIFYSFIFLLDRISLVMLIENMIARRKNEHVIQLFENDCGTAVVVGILKYYGCNANYIRIRYAINNSDKGTSVKDIKLFFNKCNISSKIFKLPKSNRLNMLMNVSEENFPCILMLSGEVVNHYIILYKIYNNGKCLISDPEHSKIEKIELREIVETIQLIISCKVKNELNIPEKYINKNDNSLMMKLVKKYIQQIINIFLISVVTVIINIFITSIFGLAIDQIIPNIKTISFFLILLMIIIFSILGMSDACLKYFKFTIAQRLTNSVEKSLYSEYVHKIFNLKYNYYQNIKSGELMTRLKEGIQITNMISTILTNLIVDFLTIIISIIILFCISSTLSIVIVISCLLCGLIINYFFNKMVHSGYEISKSKAELDSEIISSLSKIETIKTFNEEEVVEEKINKLVESYIEKRNLNLELSKDSIAYQNIVIQLSNIILITIGILFISINYMSIGSLVIFLNISGMLFSNILEVVGIQVDIEMFVVGYKRFLLILNEFEIDNEDDSLFVFNEKIKSIEFQNFSLSYEANILLKDINLDLFQNSKNVVLYGESGCGKSSLVRTLIGINENYTGRIYLNNICIDNINNKSIRNEIIYLSNISTIRETSIINFLTDGKKIPMREIIKVCSDLNILDVIERLPNQFNYCISDDGMNISLGQKQRLLIAHAILKNPSLIIFDETFSNIDLKNKRLILDKLKNYDILKLFITHQSLDLEDANIFYFKNLKLIKKGE